MTKPMVRECIVTKTGQNMRESGKRINSMELVLKHGQMELSTEEVTVKVRSMERES